MDLIVLTTLILYSIVAMLLNNLNVLDEKSSNLEPASDKMIAHCYSAD